MIESILRFSIERRYFVLSLIFVLVGLGVWSYQKLPIDAVPDITNVQVQINTEAPGYSPLEAEQRITYPVEAALAGIYSTGGVEPSAFWGGEPHTPDRTVSATGVELIRVGSSTNPLDSK